MKIVKIVLKVTWSWSDSSWCFACGDVLCWSHLACQLRNLRDSCPQCSGWRREESLTNAWQEKSLILVRPTCSGKRGSCPHDPVSDPPAHKSGLRPKIRNWKIGITTMISEWALQAMGERTKGVSFYILYWLSDAEVILATDQRGSNVNVSKRVFLKLTIQNVRFKVLVMDPTKDNFKYDKIMTPPPCSTWGFWQKFCSAFGLNLGRLVSNEVDIYKYSAIYPIISQDNYVNKQ